MEFCQSRLIVLISSMFAALVFALAASSPAVASPIGFSFLGSVTSVDPSGTFSSVATGTEFSGSFSFDLDPGATDTNADGDTGDYLITGIILTIDIGGDVTNRSGLSGILRAVNNLGGINDLLSITAGGSSELFAFSLVDGTQSVLTDDSIPTLAQMQAFPFDQLNEELRIFEGGLTTADLNGRFSSMSFVPEPSTALLLASGLVAMAAGRRRRI